MVPAIIDVKSRFLSRSDWPARTTDVVMMRLRMPPTVDEHIANLPNSELMILSSVMRNATVGGADTH